MLTREYIVLSRSTYETNVVPFTFPMSITSTSTTLDIVSPDNKAVARVVGGTQPGTSTNTTLHTTVKDGVLSVLDNDGFGKILHDQLLTASTTFTGRGSANATVQTPVGLVNITRIPFAQNFTLKGALPLSRKRSVIEY